jgi:hypothetical protein
LAEFSVSAAFGLVVSERDAEDRQMTKRKKHGEVTQYDKPHWDPLLKLLSEYLVVDFMWMHEIALKDGTCLHAYKNRETKRYLHLSTDGRVFEYCGEDKYREVEITLQMMELVLATDRPRPYHDWADFDDVGACE